MSNNVTIALSNEEMTKIKVVDLEKLYNFAVEHFFIPNHNNFLSEDYITSNSESCNN